ncbi:MAG: glycosyltransferase [Nanoarchaeota archaeon]
MFNLEAAFNSLSFGNISFGITYELYKRGISPNIFPISGNVDISAFDKAPEDFKQYLSSCINKSAKNFKLDSAFCKIWHITNSWHKLSNKNNNLLTFFESTEITSTERNILNSFDRIFVTSTHSKKIFEENGVNSPVFYTPMGFDPLHYNKINKKFYDDGITFLLAGKFEARKGSKKVIQSWIKKYGNNKNYRLHCHITNPFFKPEDMNKVYGEIFEGKQPPFNIVLYGIQATNSLYSQCLNACDIVIDMSSAETISLPSMTAVALGKHCVCLNSPGIQDWSNDNNSVIVQPNGLEPIYDNVFFHKGAEYNQGERLTWSEDEFLAACDKAIERYNKNPINEPGFELQKRYSYENGVNIILKEMGLM